MLTLGLVPLVLILMAASWALVEEPSLVPGAVPYLRKTWAGIALLVFGEACLYYFVEGKERLAPLALACFAVAALWLVPKKKSGLSATRISLLATAIFLFTYGFVAWSSNVNLVAGPILGQAVARTIWFAAVLAFLLVMALAHQAVPNPSVESPMPRRHEIWGLLTVLVLGAALRFPQLGTVPNGIWFDELNLSRVTEAEVLAPGQAPLYVSDLVENPGAYLWVGAATYKVFGIGLLPYRYLAAIFGLLAIVPFWALARLWFGPRWALVGATLFATMRWTLIPQRIGFMSGFALFWMLAALWAYWSARLKGKNWRWILAGALLGCNLHTYTPGRLVLVLMAAFILLDLPFHKTRARPWAQLHSIVWLILGFLMTAGPMLWYIASHWDVYALRSGQVSIFADAAKSGQSLGGELWTSLSKHLLMFNLRGDFNARHNLHYYPHVDLLTASALALSLPYVFGRFFKDARARFLVLWFILMLSAGIFTLAVEAPQGHRTILAAPVIALAVLWTCRDLLGSVGTAFARGWPRAGWATGLLILFSVVAFNGYEVFGLWAHSSETWRSFSPFATAVGRRAAASGPDVEVHLSSLKNEYQFHGYESMTFANYFLRPQQRLPLDLKMGTVIGTQPEPRAVLLIWGESDIEMTAAFAKEFPDSLVEKPANPYPVQGEPSALYFAAEVPWSRIPLKSSLKSEFLIARNGAP